MSLYEVQEFTVFDGWINNWTHTQDGSEEPVYFNSREGAEIELDEFFADMAKEVIEGNMADVPDRETFRIVEVSDERNE
jgi:hypothetical protein